jgi:ADP-ribose pyrophosphatase YjhB (NUDIX family)
MQMYKVFVNDCPIFLTENNNISTNLKKERFNDVSILAIIDAIFKQEIQGICLICSDLNASWKAFKKCFKIQKAAGGKVLNTENEVLFIYRFDKWDLPKGKLHKNETIQDCAIREVQEECGIENLQIIKQLETTYHIYPHKNNLILKITYWYLMRSNFTGNLIPQTNEGIEKVVFKTEKEVQFALKNTYENIKLLF